MSALSFAEAVAGDIRIRRKITAVTKVNSQTLVSLSFLYFDLHSGLLLVHVSDSLPAESSGISESQTYTNAAESAVRLFCCCSGWRAKVRANNHAKYSRTISQFCMCSTFGIFSGLVFACWNCINQLPGYGEKKWGAVVTGVIRGVMEWEMTEDPDDPFVRETMSESTRRE